MASTQAYEKPFVSNQARGNLFFFDALLREDTFEDKFMMTLRRLLTITVSLVIAATHLRADQVTLTNGDRVTGKLIQKEGDKLTMKTDLLGEVTIAWESVESISSQAALVVVLPGGKTLVGKLEGDEQKKLGVATTTTKESVPLSELVALRDDATQKRHERLQNPGLLDLWEGSIDLGLSAARGNARTNTFTTGANATRTTRTDKTSAHFSQIYSTALVEGTQSTTAEAIRGGWSYNRNLSSRLFINLFNDYEYDRFQNLDLRFVGGGGLGFNAIKDDRKQLDLVAGAAYNREAFNTPLIRHSAEAYWGDDFHHKLSETLQIQQKFRMFNNLSDPGPYRMNFDLSVVTNINKWLSWNLAVSDRFLSEPVLGRQRNDVLYSTGLRLRFAR